MNYKQFYNSELSDISVNYFILDTKGAGTHGDIDFVQYQWSRSKFNRMNEGDLVVFRRPGTSSETRKFYFFGAAKIGEITGDDRVTALLDKVYPFQDYLHQSDLEEYVWSFKDKGSTWEHFFNQYGMNKIDRSDFVGLLELSNHDGSDYEYSPDIAKEALQDIQKEDYFAEDNEGLTKKRTKQNVFSNKVKSNYKNKCAICSISTKSFLVGSHIIPWSKRKDIRLDPSNGICLCSFHDKAFDKGYITINSELKVVVSDKFKGDSVLLHELSKIKGSKIKEPTNNKPKEEFLLYHHDKIFESFLKKK